jgi:hypothetical protein
VNSRTWFTKSTYRHRASRWDSRVVTVASAR